MDARATEVLAALRNTNLSVEAKTAQLTKLKSDIKQKNVPDNSVSTVFEAVRSAIASQHSSLSAAGFSALGHLLKRLYLQEQHQAVAGQGRHTYPLLLERLGDHKERVRVQASQAFSDFWVAAPTEVENHVLGSALTGRNPRAKETSLAWLASMTKERGLLFRTYVPRLVACLEDADSGVRETAKTTVLELFQNAPSRALSDLKKQLQTYNVRKSIASVILASLGLSDHDLASSMHSSQSRPEIVRPGSSFSNHRSQDSRRPNSVLSFTSNANGESTSKDTNAATGSIHGEPPRMESSYHSQSGSMRGDPPRKDALLSHSVSVESFATATGNPENEGTDGDTVEPLYVNSQREFDDMVRDMSQHFEGRESEQNWIPRDKSVTTLRRLTKGNAPHDYHGHYIAAIKSLLDGILKAVNSLRTTLSAAGCYLIQDIARTCGSAIDHMVEVLLQNMIKVCAGLKKIQAQNGNVTVDAIIGNVSYSTRILQHIWGACQDKNAQPRLYATGWIKTILTRHGKHRGTIEHSGGLDIIEKCIKRGLGDANPGVRENMRGTFWVFAKSWPDRGDGILSGLDAKSRALLEKDPGNPNLDPNSINHAPRPKSGMSNNSSHKGEGRMTLKETIAAQKKARLGVPRNLPARPESAQSAFSDAKSTKPSQKTVTSGTSTVRSVPTGAPLPKSSLSSAPMRPGARPRRPELTRPATADPYSRRPLHGSSQSKTSSPAQSPQKPRSKTTTTTPGAKNPTPARPKSRLDGASAPVSTAKSKPKRLDIAALKAGEGRIMGTSSLNVGATSTPDSGPFHHDDDPTIVAPPQTDPSQIEDAAFHHGADPVPISADSASEDLSKSMPTAISPETRHSHPTSPRHQRLSSDGSASRIPISPSFRKYQNESPSVAASTPHRYSRGISEDIARQTPTHIPRPSLAGTDDIQPAEPLKVYEDPQSPSSKGATSPPGVITSPPTTPQVHVRHAPLEELPLNEPATIANRKPVQQPEPSGMSPPSILPSNENLHRRWKKVEIAEKRRSLSPRSKDPAKAQDMIERGLNKIKAGAIDVHGYRKFQSLLKYHESIIQDEDKYHEVLLALLNVLESSSDTDKRSGSGRSLDLKTQVLVTVRLMFHLNRRYFSTYYAKAVIAILKARRHYEVTNHIVSGLEETSEDIVAACDPPEVIEAVLDLLEPQERSAEAYRMMSMGIYILNGLLHRLNEKHTLLRQPDMERLGKFANRNLRDPQPDMRRAIIDFCLELHQMVKPEEKFWKMIDSAAEDFRPLLTYYIVRNPARV